MSPSAPALVDPRRTQTFQAVERIRISITLYLLVPLMSLFNAVVVTATVLTSGAFVVGNFGGSGIGGLIESNSAAIAITGELTAFIALILTIVAWLTWRGGVRDLADAPAEYGSAQFSAAQDARRDYGYTLYTWLAIFFFGIAVVVVIIALVLGTIVNNINSGEPSGTAAANAIGAVVGVLAVLAVVGIVLTILLYYFATRSLVGSISTVSTPAIRARLDRARTTILVGAVLGILAEGALVDRLLYPLAILGPLVLVVGFVLMRSGYAEWLGAPPVPGPSPMLAPGGAPPSPPLG